MIYDTTLVEDRKDEVKGSHLPLRVSQGLGINRRYREYCVDFLIMEHKRTQSSGYIELVSLNLEVWINLHPVHSM
jgi:hypothetical protein